MIKHIFWDIDECICHCTISDPNQESFPFVTEHFEKYWCIVRPKAKELIEFSRQLVGTENVYILTAATKDYAKNVNRVADFAFPDSHILSREDIRARTYPTAYGGSATIPHTIADPNNILIDNMPPRDNYSKIDFLGIKDWKNRYLKVREYYGANFDDEAFEEDVRDFLTSLVDKVD